MMKMILLAFMLLFCPMVKEQHTIQWPEGKQALIVLTYDDALSSQLDIAIPQLDKANLKATFFLNEPALEQIARWKAVSSKGHELGNHTVYHPCLSSKFQADPRYHAENYTVKTILREISSMNKMLYAIDNKSRHSYAYPCCETSVGGKSYVDSLRKCGIVKYARTCGTPPLITDFKNLDPFLVPCMSYNGEPSGEDLVDFVKSVRESKGMGVFIFHGVGGDYLKVSSQAHQELIQYLKDNNDIWVAPFGEAMDYVTKESKK